MGFAAVDAREIRRGVQDLAVGLEGESRTWQRREVSEIAAKRC